MERKVRKRASEERPACCFLGRMCKRAALSVIVGALVLGSAGCAAEDLLSPFAGDIPFEQNTTVPSEMGAVDNTPTVPDDDAALGNDRPF